MKTYIKTLRGFLLVGALLLSAPSDALSREVGIASWYGQWHHGRLMANGEPFNKWALTAAHRTIPLGSEVRIRNLRNGEVVIATITDRGPYVRGRIIDVSLGVAHQLRMAESGLAPVEVTIIYWHGR